MGDGVQSAGGMKRSLDLGCALGGLVVLSPLFALMWLAVVAETGRPGFFRQQRAGCRGRYFSLLKFRTMTVRCGAEYGSFDAGSTTRVTRFGTFLRKTKLDELPQLWNVLKGDMSLVGPRPEVRKWVEAYPERWARVLTVRPGITDPASIEFRNEEEILATSPDPERTYREMILPRKLDLYEKYVATRSFQGDVAILIKTFWAVIAG
jgi:lipopolysaccharide/colanic/teichoic acid biosynthesis glycosyltransferase